MHDRAADRRQITHRIEQPAHAIAIAEAHLGQGRTRAHDAFVRRDHRRLALNDDAAILVNAGAGEGEMAVVWIAGGDLDRNAQGVTDAYRSEEAQGLAKVDRAGAGQACAEHGRDQ